MPHASRSSVSDLRDDDQFLAAGERDVALVEEVIDVRRQQQPERHATNPRTHDRQFERPLVAQIPLGRLSWWARVSPKRSRRRT